MREGDDSLTGGGSGSRRQEPDLWRRPRLRLGGERRKREAGSENNEPAIRRMGHLGGGWLGGSLAEDALSGRL